MIEISDNAFVCSIIEKVIETCALSVEDIPLPEGFEISPNPTNDRLRIKFVLDKPEPVRIILLNFSGQQIVIINEEQLIAGEFLTESDISRLPPGVYLCQVLIGQRTISQKIFELD